MNDKKSSIMPLLIVVAVLVAVYLIGSEIGGAIVGGAWRGECDAAWADMDVDAGDESMTVNFLLNNNWPPDSVGAYLAKCIDRGWTGYR